MLDFIGGAFFGAFMMLSVGVFYLVLNPSKRQPFYDFIENLGDDTTDE